MSQRKLFYQGQVWYFTTRLVFMDKIGKMQHHISQYCISVRLNANDHSPSYRKLKNFNKLEV